MANRTFVSLVGAGAKHSMIMPQVASLSGNVSISTGQGTTELASAAAFYSQFETVDSNIGYDATAFTPASGTSEQTMLDTGTGQTGVLTVVKSASVASGGITIRVTADGVEHVFVQGAAIANGTVLIAGDFATWLTQTGATSAVGYGSNPNTGYAVAVQDLTLLSPIDSASKGLPIGIVFRDSLVITIQATDAFNTTSSERACAAWLTNIPDGV